MSDLPTPDKNTAVRWIIVGIVILAVLGLVMWLLWRQKIGDTVEPQDNSQTTTTTSQAPVIIPGALLENDKDLDGLDDAKEAEYGTSDLEFDTDGDGLRDVDEIEVWKTNPTQADTDGDGFTDGFEVFKGYDPNGPGRLPDRNS